ncbi:MAG: hypothetical protein ACE5KT_04960 [Methanosarcinales archaeon]
MDTIVAHLENNELVIPKDLLKKIGVKDKVQIKVKNNTIIITSETDEISSTIKLSEKEADEIIGLEIW